MSSEENTCAACNERYEYDTDAAPAYCALYCSRGCAQAGGWDFTEVTR